MKINTDINSDRRTVKPDPGGYEWWYFDAISLGGDYRLTIVFYEGNPFSTRYNKRLNNGSRSYTRAENFPAVSISVYEHNEPVFFSFTEYRPEEAVFHEGKAALAVGSNRMEAAREGSSIIYKLNLKEKLPNGDAIVGSLDFGSNILPEDLLQNDSGGSEKHAWNLIMPRAEVNGKIRIYSRNEETKLIDFSGTGYHDHNIGLEHMKHKFREWYWGRYHFEYGTFIYYIMNMNEKQQHNAWIINKAGDRVLHTFEDITLQDKTLSLYGLINARKLIFHSSSAQVNIQQTKILDNTPFNQRYSSDAFLHVPENDAVEASEGFSEYVRPDRIFWRVFWPLINMRIRYRSRSPHWIQYSKRLYRWTW